jgi:hypothetical protein
MRRLTEARLTTSRTAFVSVSRLDQCLKAMMPAPFGVGGFALGVRISHSQFGIRVVIRRFTLPADVAHLQGT